VNHSARRHQLDPELVAPTRVHGQDLIFIGRAVIQSTLSSEASSV
jgi:hypothetical protein